MNVSIWLKASTKQLTEAGIGTARLDALVLLEDCLCFNRAHLLAHPELTLTKKQVTRLASQLKQRENHQPLAYVRGKTEFYGCEFVISPAVLEPRPESETMIDLLKSVCKDRPCNVVDVGTGSGALAITAKLELPQAEVFAIDIDPKCLAVARKNAKQLNADITFFQGDLLSPIPPSTFQLLTIILANLPYVPNSYQINDAAQNEPRIAIFGGTDGLDIYRQLFLQIADNSQLVSYVLTESLPFQHSSLEQIAKASGYSLLTTDDFIQVFKRE